MEHSLLNENYSQNSYLNGNNNMIEENYVVKPENHLNYFYDIANVGRKTGKRRKSVDKDSDGMDNMSDFFGEDDSDEDTDEFEERDELNTLDGYDETTDNFEDNDYSDRIDETTVEDDQSNIDNSHLIQKAVERIQKIIQETPSKSKIDMTPVLNSVLKASKLNNENDTLYSYKSLQESNNEVSKDSINSKNSIHNDTLYEYDEDIKDISSDNSDFSNYDNDEILETESSDDDEFIIDVSKSKKQEKRSSNRYKLRSKYKTLNNEPQLDIGYTLNSDSDSNVIEELSEDSEENNNYLSGNKNNKHRYRESVYPEYEEVQSFSNNNRRSSRRLSRRLSEKKSRNSIIPESSNNKNNNGKPIINNPILETNNNYDDTYDLGQDNIEINNEGEIVDKSTSDMSITKESSSSSIKETVVENYINNKKSQIELMNSKNKVTSKNPVINDKVISDKSNTSKINNEHIAFNDINNQEISENIIVKETVESSLNNNYDNNSDNDNNDNLDFNNDFNDVNFDNDLSNNNLDYESTTNNNNKKDKDNDEQDINDINNKENINDERINIQINILNSKSKKSSKNKKKNKLNDSDNNNINNNNNNNVSIKNSKRKYEEEVPLRKSSRKRIPPCRYWEGERPEDLLVLSEDEIKERRLQRERDIQLNEKKKRRKRRTKQTIKKNNDTENRPSVEMVDVSTSPIKGLSNPNEIDFSKSLNREFKKLITTYNTITKKETKQRLLVTQKMLKPMPVLNNSYKFTKIFSEDMTYATGLLLFPKGSSKPNRNSRDNIFFVITGELDVQVHKTKFTVSAGDHFIVPNGNQYMMKNLQESESKLWFVQCKAKKNDVKKKDK
ncbi:hypothetical protein BCR32DRAFT_241224 [Anaeromyces robustus]|uniref:Mif2/CENP-C cupin domain-containing protein n=1 Tax=Anaeromyces robustus TaxID=1754192 RepID=A0A1Y1XKE0_9FUNG|nr:hypothetical protein BCR32DRAFT_241224 [Anaeromyces robustus]|eukprot:ORX86230.1 hypothetical protein BCR32DRAFT_241224 [Anaeromyces robustus]